MLNNIVVRIREALLDKLLDQVSEEAKKSPRLRMNYNFHQSLEDKCHRFLNAVEPGTVVAIHRRVAKDECFVVLRGKVGVTTHNDDGSIIDDVVLRCESGCYGRLKKDVRDMVDLFWPQWGEKSMRGCWRGGE